jgi:hypothetical protein
MSAAPNEASTHNVGERISWTLRPPISTKINLVKLENGDEFDVPEGGDIPAVGDEAKGSTVVEVLTWEDRRGKMEDVCYACHEQSVIDGHYEQFDNVVDLYNEKFAKPIAAVMGELKEGGYITPAPFDDKIEWTWWEIWHHEGRRARHGASMSGPDYTWWHGMYEVAQHTYFKWIPELKDVVDQEGRQRGVRRCAAGQTLQADRRPRLVLQRHEQGPDRDGAQGLRGPLRQGCAEVARVDLEVDTPTSRLPRPECRPPGRQGAGRRLSRRSHCSASTAAPKYH